MKTEYNHGGAISNVWQDRSEFRWSNRAGEGAEPTFELAVQAAEHALLIATINALPRGAALCDHSAYIFHPDDDPAQPAQLLVDVVAWRTNSQRAEDEQFRDLSDMLHAIESLPAVRDIEQVGNVDHENGRGWTYQVTLV